MSKSDKLNKAKQIMREINKKHKEVVLDFASNQKKWERQMSGIPEFDELTGGFAFGHTNIVWGQSGAGKSTLMYHTIAQAQKDGKIVAFLDLEDSFNEERAENFGVQLDELMIGHYEVAEQALDTIIKLAKEKAVDIIILDSIHSMAPKGEVEDKKGMKSVEKDSMALLARKLAQFFRMAGTLIYKSNIALIMIGQTRTDLGGFIALQKLSGGNALIHNSVLTVHLRRGAKKDAPKSKYKELFLDPDDKLHKRAKDEIVGFDVVAKINKKQVSEGEAEGTEIHLPFHYDTGFIVNYEIGIEERITGTEEEKKKIRQLLIQDASPFSPLKPEDLSISRKKIVIKCDEESNAKIHNIQLRDKNDKIIKEIKPKRKRGRPRKEK